jgi:hypothetical protein
MAISPKKRTPENHENPPRGFCPFEQRVLEKWKSVKHVYAFLKREFDRINVLCFEGTLPLPLFQIKPMRLSRRPLEEFQGAATYQPAREDHPPEIALFPSVLLDREETKIALAHEIVHHWEWTTEEREDSETNLSEVDAILRERFSDPSQEKRWRSRHSDRFLTKIRRIAQALQRPVEDFLFKK